jgi:hypothetical protein
MTEILLDKKHQGFELLNEYIKDALNTEVKISDQWEIKKEYFEAVWNAEQLHESVIKIFNVRLSNSEIETDFHEDDDVESLSNCFVEFECINALKELFIASGLRPKFSIDVFNDIYGSNICLTCEDDIANNVNLFRVDVEDNELLGAKQNNLIEFFKNFKDES